MAVGEEGKAAGIKMKTGGAGGILKKRDRGRSKVSKGRAKEGQRASIR